MQLKYKYISNPGSPQHARGLGNNFNNFWELYKKRLDTHLILMLGGNIAA
jgi:hypothetical protein